MRLFEIVTGIIISFASKGKDEYDYWTKEILLEVVYDFIQEYGPITEYCDFRNETSRYKRFKEDTYKRINFISDLGWTVPSEEGILKMVAFFKEKRVLSIGSGCCLTEWFLKQYGIDIIATDSFTSHGTSVDKTFMPVEILSHLDAVAKYNISHDALLLCWPIYSTSMGYETIKAFKGDSLIFIGEAKGGCTGTDDMYAQLARDWKLLSKLYCPRWHTTIAREEYIYIYTRNKEPLQPEDLHKSPN